MLEQEENPLVPAQKNGTRNQDLTADLTAVSAYNSEQSLTSVDK